MKRLLPIVVALAAWSATAQDIERRKGFEVSIVEPENQTLVFGKTRIAADVRIDRADLIDRVEFRVGDETIFVDSEPPFETFHDFGEDAKSHVIRAIAHHVEGITVSDAVITRKANFIQVERVNRVVLWVTAYDKKGNLVKDLTRDDFTVLENGKEMNVLEFTREERPINLAMLIDTSGSMLDKIDAVHDAAGDFVDTLRDIDRALVIDFDDNVFLIQDLTDDREALRAALSSTEPIGATSLYDALHAAYRKVGAIEGRKAIVLLSDGEDTSSQFGYKRVLEEAKLNNALIYSIGVGGSLGTATQVLDNFSEFTGGRAFFVKRADQLAEAYQRIADELGNQYYLTYSTDNQSFDGRWMKLQVESSRKDVEIRARRGYFAVKSAAVTGGSSTSP